MDIILDGKEFINRELSHKYLKEKFNFPDHYGENLDALWDLLSESPDVLTIVIVNREILIENLAGYGLGLIEVFKDLNQELENIVYYDL